MIQKWCVLHYWRQIINAVYGPFDTPAEAEAFVKEFNDMLTRDGGSPEVRIQTRRG